MSKVLVTGASGFIGRHLVRRLTEQGVHVRCLVRSGSNVSALEAYQPEIVRGDILDPPSLQRAMAGVDVVYHLAGATKALSGSQLQQANVTGARQIAECCAMQANAPVLVHVSSLAAAGPSQLGDLRPESATPAPVSRYGQSKLAGELAVAEFCDRVPVSIVRPPIVLGEGDQDGLAMFESIATWNLHVVPGLEDAAFSLIHADDLAHALTLVAQCGRRVADPRQSAEGIYHAASVDSLTYAELGRRIGRAMGRRHVRVVRVPHWTVWSIATANEALSQIRRRPHILGFDKAREATAGSWTCDSHALRSQTQFQPLASFSKRLEQTVNWYVEQGWLRRPKTTVRSVPTIHPSTHFGRPSGSKSRHGDVST